MSSYLHAIVNKVIPINLKIADSTDNAIGKAKIDTPFLKVMPA